MLHTKLKNGIGYGEYVHGSIDKNEKIPYWTCFYLHFMASHVNICADPINKKYSRIHILLSNNSYIQDKGEHIFNSLIPNKYYKSKSNKIYYIDWNIEIQAVLTNILEKIDGKWLVVHGQRSTGRKPEDPTPVFPKK